MKKVILMFFLVLPVILTAQDINEINRLISYKRYETAADKAKALDLNNGHNMFWLTQVYVASKDSGSLVGLNIASPVDPWMKLAKANVLLTKGETAAARTLFDEAIGNGRKKDMNIVSAAARSNIYNDKGDRQYAVELLHQAIKKDKRNPELYTMLGDAWFRLRNGSEAYKAYSDALEANSSYAPALFQLGKIFATQNNPDLYMKYYNDAVAADPAFAPAWYELYYQSYNTDKLKAYEYYQKYMAVTDVTPSDEYQLLDMLYLTKRFDEAITKANDLLNRPDAQNRINKLLAYTYNAMDKTDNAVAFMNTYFTKGADSSFLVKDYELMAELYEKKEVPDSAANWYLKALPLLKDSTELAKYYKKLSDHYKAQKDYHSQVPFAAAYYNSSDKATNVDLFNWGFALFMTSDYDKADSVFGIYTQKYPDHVHGPYWQARAMAAIDTAMVEGLAVPHYEKMIAIAEQDTSNAQNKRYLAEAYGYIAAYVANEKKDYPMAIDYFEKLLEVDPANSDAKRYIDILEKRTNTGADK